MIKIVLGRYYKKSDCYNYNWDKSLNKIELTFCQGSNFDKMTDTERNSQEAHLSGIEEEVDDEETAESEVFTFSI